MTHQITAGRVHFVGVAIQTLVLDAFGIQDYQLFSRTNPLRGRWDVEATMQADSSPEQVASMFRTLLKDRFGLQEHSEKRAIPVYALTSVSGNKLQPTMDPSGRQVGRPVLDRTGLEGRYEIGIEYSRDVNLENAAGADVSSAPSLFTVLKDKLGLKLEPKKEDIDCIVVDSVALTPTPN